MLEAFGYQSCGWSQLLLHRFLLAEDRNDILDRYDEQLVIGFEINWDGVFGVEENLVVLSQRYVLIVSHLAANGNDSTGDRGDFGRVGKSDSTLGFSLGFVFEDEHARSDWFDVLERGVFLRHEVPGQLSEKGGPPRKGSEWASKCQINGQSAGRQDDFVQNCDWFQPGCS